MRRRERVLKLFGAVLLAGCGVAAAFTGRAGAPTPRLPTEWPTEWDGRPVRPLALGRVEQRFADRFPGAIARLSDGRRLLVLRRVREPTRMLHPAADCYRGVGWRVSGERLEVDGRGRRWRCFEADRQGRRLLVCERIVDADGRAWTDASSWFWAALLGRSDGPWQAITTARPI